jgi:ketosteroid isomerase-like protein
MSAPTTTSLHDLATSFLSAFTHLDTAAHTSLRAPSCTHIFAPSSLGMPTKSNAEFAHHLDANIRPIISGFPCVAKEIHVNEAGRQVTIWATGTPEIRAEAKDDGADWEYVGEYIFLLDVDEQGRIVRVLEFLDSKGTERVKELMGRGRKNLGIEKVAW